MSWMLIKPNLSLISVRSCATWVRVKAASATDRDVVVQSLPTPSSAMKPALRTRLLVMPSIYQ